MKSTKARPKRIKAINENMPKLYGNVLPVSNLKLTNCPTITAMTNERMSMTSMLSPRIAVYE